MGRGKAQAGGTGRGSALWRMLAEDAREVVPALADWFDRIVHRQARAPVADRAALTAALAEHARFLGQSSVYAYCRARTGFMAPKLFNEEAFVESAGQAAWEAFAACLADMTLVVEGALRGVGPAAPPARAGLFKALYRDALQQEGIPAHRSDWSDAIQAFDARIAFAVEGPVRGTNEIGETAGRTIYDHLPFHDDMLRPDEEMVLSSVRFRMVRTVDDLLARIDRPRLDADLAGQSRS